MNPQPRDGLVLVPDVVAPFDGEDADEGLAGFDAREGGEDAGELDRFRPGAGHRLVVLTGGEPLLQVDAALIDALHAQQFRIAVESNGTVAAPEGIDWLCISPKAGAPWVQRSGQELKLVWPQPGFDLPTLEQDTDFAQRYLQPMDGPLQHQNTALCIDTCMQRPAWRLSLQTHKLTGIR